MALTVPVGPSVFASRLAVMQVAVAASCLLLMWRLFTLQILRGEELSDRGRDNFVQRVEVPHDRGIIYDRFGRILADNRPSSDLVVTPHFLGDRALARATLERLAVHLELDSARLAALQDQVFGKRGLDKFVPLRIARNLTSEQVEGIEAERGLMLLDGVDIVDGRRRAYPYGTIGAHVLGYLGEIDPASLARERQGENRLQYKRGDTLGRAGVERRLEAGLRGVDGFDNVVVDAKGRQLMWADIDGLLGPERHAEPRPGNNVFLTLDAELQQRAEEAFTGFAGAVIALDPRDGAVLALISAPAFDPNRLSAGLAPEEQARLQTDLLKPQMNRALQGQFVPGSTFKVVTAIAALETRTTTPTETVFCPGHFRLGSAVWRCHKDEGHGYVALKEALKVSCDTYFYTMAARMGIDAIAGVGRRLGLGALTGIGLGSEKPGLMPDSVYHNRVEPGGYQKGMAVNAGIGQGAVLVTPLQLAAAYGAIATGTWRTPHVIARVESPDYRVLRRTRGATGAPVTEVTGDAPQPLPVDFELVSRAVMQRPEVLDTVRAGLLAVVAEPGGTAYSRRSTKTTMAGKTGTAQVVKLGKDRLKPDQVAYAQRDHAWFVAYAPAEAPEIVVAVLNEHSGHGGSHAAPIAVAVIDAYMDLKSQRSQTASLPANRVEQSP